MGNGTSIGRVRGHGSAHHGAHHWLLQRFTAVGNLLLGLYLVFAFVMLPDLSYATLTDWLSGPIQAIIMALFVISTFWHARMGMQVLAEDYVKGAGNKFAAVLVLNLLTFAGIAAGLFFLFTIVTQASGAATADAATQQAIEELMQGMAAGGPQ